MKIYTKESLIIELKKIAAKGWIDNARHGNHGGIGNTLEDLLGIEENNLPIPNAAEWVVDFKIKEMWWKLIKTHYQSWCESLKYYKSYKEKRRISNVA